MRSPSHQRDHKDDPSTAASAVQLGQEIQRQRIIRSARRHLDREERGPIAEPEILTLAELLAEPESATLWRIEGWQPAESRVMLTAPRKAGKTTAIGSLVRGFVDGDRWLGRYPVQPVAGSVCLIDTEMARGQIKRWYRDQQIQHVDRVLVIPLRGHASALDLLDADRRARWADWLRSRDVRYLIIDNLRPILDALGLDESREAGRWLVGLDALLREANIPDACLVHHMGHQTGQTNERARGDSRLRDWPDVEWRVVRQDDQDDASPRYIRAYGRDVDIRESQLTYDAKTRRLTISGGTRQEARVTRALDAVIEAIKAAAQPQSTRQIETALNDSDHGRDVIRTALRQGIRDGRLTVEDGPRRSRLYRVCECAGVRDECAAHSSAESVRECASAYIDTRTPRTLSTQPDGARDLLDRSAQSERPRRPSSDGLRNNAETRRRAREGER
jgi:hypothetical protein